MPPSGAVPFPRVFVLSRCFTERCRWLENPASKQQWQDVFRRERLGEIEALHLGASPGFQQFELLTGLDAFCDGHHAQFPRKCDGSSDYGRAPWVDRNLPDEVLRDLYPIGWVSPGQR